MKRALIVSLLFAATGLFLFKSCTPSSVTTVGNPDYELPEGEKAFYSQAVKAMPVIAPSSPSASSIGLISDAFAAEDWSPKGPTFEIFNLLREYVYPRDEGILDMSNIYKFLFEVSEQYSIATILTEPLNSPKAIKSPYNFGTDPVTYTDASGHYALSRNGDTINALLTWIWNNNEYAVIEGSFNDTSGELSFNLAYLVDYEGDADFCIRTSVSGNKLTHNFTLKYFKCTTGEGGYILSAMGTGISRSENPNDYFLIKMIDNDSLTSAKYYKFSASANEEELKNYPTQGYALSEIGDPENYASVLDSMSFFPLDMSEAPTSVSDFANPELTLNY